MWLYFIKSAELHHLKGGESWSDLRRYHLQVYWPVEKHSLSWHVSKDRQLSVQAYRPAQVIHLSCLLSWALSLPNVIFNLVWSRSVEKAFSGFVKAYRLGPDFLGTFLWCAVSWWRMSKELPAPRTTLEPPWLVIHQVRIWRKTSFVKWRIILFQWLKCH